MRLRLPGVLAWTLLCSAAAAALLPPGAHGQSQSQSQNQGQAADQRQLEQQLAEVRRQLEKVQREIEASQSRFAVETAALREVEKSISRTRRELARLAERIAAEAREIDRLDRQAAAMQTQLGTQTRLLGSLVRQAWVSGRGSGLRALFRIDELDGAARRLYFQRLLAEARAAQLRALRDGLSELVAVRLEAASRRQSLASERAQLSIREQELEDSRRRRSDAARELQAAIRRQERQSDVLEADGRRLNQLLEELALLFADIPEQLDAAPGLPSPAGNLQLPVDGRVLEGAGVAKADGMHRLGMLISASPGAPVSAVSYGRVAYADWLRGFGLLTIIDHGDGYLSLYAFNETLFREVGDWVGQGDVIAAAGASGGRTSPALYFELRRNGRPVDPRPWLKRRP